MQFIGETLLGTDLKEDNDSYKKYLEDYVLQPSTISELSNFVWYRFSKIPTTIYRFFFSNAQVPECLVKFHSDAKYYGPRRDQPFEPDLPYPVSPSSLGILENYGPWLGSDLTRRYPYEISHILFALQMGGVTGFAYGCFEGWSHGYVRHFVERQHRVMKGPQDTYHYYRQLSYGVLKESFRFSSKASFKYASFFTSIAFTHMFLNVVRSKRDFFNAFIAMSVSPVICLSVFHLMRWEWWSSLRMQEKENLSFLVNRLLRTKGHLIKRMIVFSFPAGFFYGLLEEARIAFTKSICSPKETSLENQIML